MNVRKEFVLMLPHLQNKVGNKTENMSLVQRQGNKVHQKSLIPARSFYFLNLSLTHIHTLKCAAS